MIDQYRTGGPTGADQATTDRPNGRTPRIRPGADRAGPDARPARPTRPRGPQHPPERGAAGHQPQRQVTYRRPAEPASQRHRLDLDGLRCRPAAGPVDCVSLARGAAAAAPEAGLLRR